MNTEMMPREQTKQKMNLNIQNNSPDAVYGLGLIGAWVFYIGRATNFREGVAGFFKGFVWPAFVVYDLLKFLNSK